MRRTNAKEIKVKNPGKGVLTRIPSNLPVKQLGQFWTVAKNVRAQDESTETAPGYERIVPKGTAPGEEEPTNLITEATLSGGTQDRNKREFTVIGTSDGLYTMAKVSQDNPCHPNNLTGVTEEPPTSIPCETTFGFFADNGQRDNTTQGIVRSQVIDQYPVDFIINAGDMVYDNGNPGWDQKLDLYEECTLYYWSDFLKGYAGPYNSAPTEAKWFATLNNHEFTDWPSTDRYGEIFLHPADAVGSGDQGHYSYSFKRGPCLFVVPDLYGPCTKAPAGVGQLDLTSTGPVATWVKNTLAASDASWNIVIMSFPPYSSKDNSGSTCGGTSPYNGYKDLRWPFNTWGAHVILSGDTHWMEHMQDGSTPKVDYIICGSGGKTLDTYDGDLIHTGNPSLGITSLYLDYTNYGMVRCEASHEKLYFLFHAADIFGDPLYEYTKTRTLTGSEVCYTGTKAKAVQSVMVRPLDNVEMEVGQQWPFKCVAFYVDGDWDDITDQATWTSNVPGYAAVNNSGIVTGIGRGAAVITAAYKGLSDTANVTIKTACTDKEKDYYLVLECSEAMNATSILGKSRLDMLKQAVNAFIDSLGPNDQISIRAYNGQWSTQTPAKALNLPLTNDFNTAKAAVNALRAYGSNALGTYISGSRHTSNTTGRTDADQQMIIFIDTTPNISPGGSTASLAASQSDAMTYVDTQVGLCKDAGMCVYFIDLDIYEESTYKSQMELWADNPGNFEHLTSAEQLYSTFVNLNNKFCGLGCDGAYYKVEPPGACAGSTPRLNYTDFDKWFVEQNEVDLIGVGNTGEKLYDVYKGGAAHGQGLYVDLAGSGPHFYGRIRSKKQFDLAANETIEIKFKLAGNWRQPTFAPNHQEVYVVFGQTQSSGTLLAEVIVIDDYKQEFTEYVYEVRPSAAITGLSLYFEQFISRDPEHYSAVGCLLDEITITNLTTSTVLLYDDFDTETC
jgi:hypothetical protein